MTDVLAYHQLSKHAPERFAPGPGQLDWATQPAPFRRYDGARLIELYHRPLEEGPAYDVAFAGPQTPPAPLNRASVSQLLYDSLAISAWKEAGGSRWALRVNPSSGNLHPTEAYLLLPPGIVDEDGVLAHYAPDVHALEVRSELPPPLCQQLADCLPPGGFLLGLSSIVWREAWKYGERAYRYCQHDLGHALAALAIAASVQGWQVRMLHGVAEVRLDGLLGLDDEGFHEAEHGDCLLWIGPAQKLEFALPETLLTALAQLERSGAPNRLSREYRHWPELQRIHGLCRAPARPRAAWSVDAAGVRNDNPGLPLRPILHRRRSAQSMDGRSGIQAALLLAWLRRLMPQQSPVPFAVTGEPSEIDLLLFIHRVQGLRLACTGWIARAAVCSRYARITCGSGWTRNCRCIVCLKAMRVVWRGFSAAARTLPPTAVSPWPCWHGWSAPWRMAPGVIHGSTGNVARLVSCSIWKPRRPGFRVLASVVISTTLCGNCSAMPTAAGKVFTISPLAALYGMNA